MSSQNEELRTSIIWDTGTIERAVRTVETAYDREKKARESSVEHARRSAAQTAAISMTEEERARRKAAVAPPGDHPKGPGGRNRFIGDAINAVTGSSGNVSRMTMLTHALPKLAGVAGGLLAAYETGKKLVANINGELKENSADSERLRIVHKGASDRSRFASFTDGPDALSDQMGDNHKRMDDEAETQRKLQRYEGKKHDWWNPVNAVAYRLTDWAGEKMTGHSNSQDLSESRQRIASDITERKRLDQLRSQALEHTAGSTRERLEGSEAEAGRMDLAKGRAAALANAKEKQFTPEQTALVSKEWDVKDRDHERQVHTRGRDTLYRNSETAVRAAGADVEEQTAALRVGKANEAVKGAGTAEQKAAARAELTEAVQAHREAKAASDERKLELADARKLAEFRGTSEQRTIFAARQALELQEQIYKIEQRMGPDRERKGKVTLEQKKQELALAEQPSQDRRSAVAMGLRNTGEDRAGSRFHLGLDSYSQNDNVRFAAGQFGERFDAASQTRRADHEVKRATERVQIEQKAQGGHASLESMQELLQAQAKLQTAKENELETEKKLTAEATQRKRVLEVGILAANNKTRGMQIANTGRADHAQVFGMRADSEARTLELARHGHTAEAKAEQQQEQEQEVGMYNEKYLRPDGRPRSRVEIHREERRRRLISHRIERADARLKRDGGLINVHRDINNRVIDGVDPLTGKRTTLAEKQARLDAPFKQAEREIREDKMNQKELAKKAGPNDAEFWKKLDAKLDKLASIDATLTARLPSQTCS